MKSKLCLLACIGLLEALIPAGKIASLNAGEMVGVIAADAQEKFMGRAARAMLEFMSAAKRGVCSDRGGGRQDDEDE